MYVIWPTSRATWLSQRDSRKAAAPSPETSILAKLVSSKSAALSRQARCSAPIAGDQSRPAQPRGLSDSSPAAAFGSNQFARSQPDFSPNAAPELDEALVRRREAERPPGLPLVAGVLDVVVGRVDLQRPRERVVAARVVGAETARVHLPDVEAREPFDDPLCDELPHAARAGQPVRAEAGSDPEPAQLGRPEDELAVRGERLRAVDEADHLGLAELRHADEGVRHQLLEPIPVLGEQLAVEVRRDPVQPPRRRVALVAAHHEAAGLAAEVDEQRRVAHRRHVERDAVRLRDQVLVRHRDDGHDDACQPTELGREHAARVDDDPGLDRALVGLDARDAAVLGRRCRSRECASRSRRRRAGRPRRARG